eukprot:XP_001702187.1 predicted protein [Chlamydomonas reinhardtii]
MPPAAVLISCSSPPGEARSTADMADTLAANSDEDTAAVAATRELELRRALELQCRLQGPQPNATGPVLQPRQPLPLPPAASPQLLHDLGTPPTQSSGRLRSGQLTWRYWAGGSYVRGRSYRAFETPQGSPPDPVAHAGASAGASNAIGDSAACPSSYAPPFYQRCQHEHQAPSAAGGEGRQSTTTSTNSSGIMYAWAGLPAAGRYSCPGIAAAPGQPQHLHLLGEQQLYTVASPFASAAAAAVVDELLEGEAGAGGGAQRQPSPALPSSAEGALSSGAVVAEPPIVAAYSCAASLSLSLALMDEGDCEPGSGYGWLYSSDDDEEYPSRPTTARSQWFASPACIVGTHAAKPRSTPPRATSSTASGASGSDLAPQQLQSPAPVLVQSPHTTAAGAKAAAQQPDEQLTQPQPHAQHRRRHRMSAPGRSSWCGWRSRPLPQAVPEDPTAPPSQGTDDLKRSYRQQAAAALSLQPPLSGMAAANATGVGGNRYQRSSAGGSMAMTSVVRNLSAPTLNVDDQAAAPTSLKKEPHATATDARSELLALLNLWG